MTRPSSIQDAILMAYLASRKGEHQEVMLCLAFALSQASRERDAARRGPYVGPLSGREELQPQR